ncbi:uncharacterized protein LOC110093148 [Dendrobium catenatum]|uniref:uncharacterized protein LOC110093148 n=1 Tax=Dendrobium catenatum TaxID=906689 RepID=UPI0009F30814|nr:uncharacterized protein LOC110093148 [Dendrobium catenatum]
MAPALGLFSSSNSGNSRELEDGPAAAGEAKPKGRRGARPPAPKKPPQRGLGVAQLERLRLQERWKMMTDTMEPTVSLPIYDLPAISRFGGTWVEAHSMPPKAAASQTQAFPALVYLPRCRSGIQIPGGGYGTFPANRPAMHEQYALDRFQFAAGNPALEPPSNQTSPLCFSNQCEFCVRKKRLFGGNSGLSNDGDFLEMNLASSVITDEANISGEYRSPRPFKSARETELKEFDFFPRSLAFSADEESEFAGASSGAGDGCSPSFIDLSLTL